MAGTVDWHDIPVSISITGDLGAGKSTVARELSEMLGMPLVSAGQAFRDEAKARGMSLAELTELCASDPSVDEAIDRRVADPGAGSPAIYDSRLAFRFVPHTFKVFVSCPEDVAAQRVLHACREGERFSTAEEARESLARRREAERERFAAMYGVDIRDEDAFDLVVDGTQAPADAAAEIAKEFALWRLSRAGLTMTDDDCFQHLGELFDGSWLVGEVRAAIHDGSECFVAEWDIVEAWELEGGPRLNQAVGCFYDGGLDEMRRTYGDAAAQIAAECLFEYEQGHNHGLPREGVTEAVLDLAEALEYEKSLSVASEIIKRTARPTARVS